MAPQRSVILTASLALLLGCSNKGTEPRDNSVLLGVDLAGTPVTIEEYRGQIVLATYWVTWSQWSDRQLRTLDSLQAEHPTDVALVAVAFGTSADSVARYLEDRPVKVRVASDDGTAMGALTNSRAFPTTLAFTKRGERYADLRGYRVLSELRTTVLAAQQSDQ